MINSFARLQAQEEADGHPVLDGHVADEPGVSHLHRAAHCLALLEVRGVRTPPQKGSRGVRAVRSDYVIGAPQSLHLNMEWDTARLAGWLPQSVEV